MAYVKLFNTILRSTIWQEPLHIKVVWITMLALTDKEGDVISSIPGLASTAGVTLTQVKEALQNFLSPDEYSSTKEFEGRRIEVISGGWHLLNHGKYRALMGADERREYNRMKQADRRRRLAGKLKDVNDSQSQSAMSPHTDADTKANPKKNKTPRVGRMVSKEIPFGKYPTEEEWDIFLDEEDLIYVQTKLTLWDKLQEKGWVDVEANPIHDWKEYVRRLNTKMESDHPSNK